MNVFVNEASDSDINKDPEYIPEDENSSNTDENEGTSSISGKYTVLNHLCFKFGYKCHITSMITSLYFSVTSLLCK
jgi:hypothetical protein